MGDYRKYLEPEYGEVAPEVEIMEPQAMEIGSLAGWDVPGADPAKYQENYPKMGGMDLG